MYVAVGFKDAVQHPHYIDLFNACVIRAATGFLLDSENENKYTRPVEKKLNFTGKAMVGINVNNVEWLQWSSSPSDKIPQAELEEMHFKMKIYACDDPDEKVHSGRFIVLT